MNTNFKLCISHNIKNKLIHMIFIILPYEVDIDEMYANAIQTIKYFWPKVNLLYNLTSQQTIELNESFVTWNHCPLVLCNTV